MSSNEKALHDARLDADLHGRGWLRVDSLGNIERIDPRAIFIDIKSPVAPEATAMIDESPMTYHEKILKRLDEREELSAQAAAVIRDLMAETSWKGK